MRIGARPTKLLKALLVFGALAAFAASCIKQEQRAEVPLTSSETPEPMAERVSTKTFQAFSHKIPEHEQFACTSCHRREGRSLKMEFPGHDSCIGCHLNEFIDKEEPAMCSICHKDTNTPEALNPFPVKFIEGFNMKFDHAAHESGEGRPPEGCASCHSPSGPGKTIPSGFQAHNNCFACHTPESKIGSCTVCHELAPYNRTRQSDYNFRYIFRHGDHTKDSCSACHNVIKGAPQSRQVTNIAILEHRTTPGNNCLQCHNGKRAFNGNDMQQVTTCARCHKDRVTKLPPNPYVEEGDL